jgi:hypothetical protein
VTYAIAHIRAGGGGTGTEAGQGGTSSVAFAGGTISATGGLGINSSTLTEADHNSAAQANSGQGATGKDSGGNAGWASNAFDGAYIVAGGAVTPAVGITVTVGAGGTAGTSGAAGGSGYVWIEYQV